MLKKLKSLFVIDDENPSEKQDSNTTESKDGSEKAASTPNADLAGSVSEGKQGQPEEKFVNRLLSALEENNLKGFDYLEYKQSLQNLSNVEMDEPTKYKSALAMATTMGANSAILIKSAQHYLKVLKTEETKFLDAFKNQQMKMVQSRENKLVQLEKSITTKQKQIEKLKKEIEESTAQLNSKKNEANKANAKVQSTKENFYASYNIVVDQINDDINKMTDYLQ